MPVDKFGRFYTGSLDKFGRYQPYSIDTVKSDEIVGKPLETPKPQKYYSDTSIALYGANTRYSEYVTYEGKSGTIMELGLPPDCKLYLHERPVPEKRSSTIKKGGKLRVFFEKDGVYAKSAVTLKVRASDKTEQVHSISFIHTPCRVFRFIQEKGNIVRERYPVPTTCYVNGDFIGLTLENVEQ